MRGEEEARPRLGDSLDDLVDAEDDGDDGGADGLAEEGVWR